MGNADAMEDLRQYLNSLTATEQDAFAARVGTTIGYLRKAISRGQQLGDGLAISIERESGGLVRCETVRPDIDWAYLRGTATSEESPSARAAAS